MSRFFVALLALIALAAPWPARAQDRQVAVDGQPSGRRVALVIGNAAYQHADRLANPVTDARNMRDALQKLGFEVVYGEDVDKRTLERKIGRFAGVAQQADVALVYFSGHGATFGDVPYVVPVDAQFESIAEMPYELVPVEGMIGELRRAKGVRIAVLDACRDNAAEKQLKRSRTRGGETTRGLARVRNPEGLILAYSTQYLDTAADGAAGGDSPFTTALLHNLSTPGLDVKELFFRVGAEVIGATKGAQRPEISVSFYDSFALVPGRPAVATTPEAPGPSPDAVTWSFIEHSTDPALFESFIARFSTSALRAKAQARLVELKRVVVAAVAPPVAPVAQAPCGGATLASLGSRDPGVLSSGEECALKRGAEFKECRECPTMVVVPPGTFTMGSPAREPERYDDEGPQHDVTIGKAFAVGKFQVTVDEFGAFVSKTGYDAGSTCWTYENVKSEERSGLSWRNPGFSQTGSHPVACVNWADAQAYVSWLSKTTGKSYRLLSEAEWEYAARSRTKAGSYPRYFFGDRERDMCRYANVGDTTAKKKIAGASGWLTFPCNDGYAFTSPVGRFAANAFGLHDMHGNVSQWVGDCYVDSYAGAPSDGSVRTAADCSRRILRGGSWTGSPVGVRAAYRQSDVPVKRYVDGGLRVARVFGAPNR